MTEQKIFQYIQFKSVVSPDFWYKLAEIKLDEEKLDENEREIFGTYTNFNTKNCLIELDCTAFNSNFSTRSNSFKANGILKNLNTIESFKNRDKNDLLRNEGMRLLSNILDGTCIKDPSKLVHFILLSYADLKKYNFYYWFAFPASIDLVIYESSPSVLISETFNDEIIEEFATNYFNLDSSQSAFFLASQNLDIILLRDAIVHDKPEDNLANYDISTTYFCFTDPSEYDNPGWMLRNYILFLYKLCPILHEQKINILSIRQNEKCSLKSSRLFFVEIPIAQNNKDDDMKWTGWEKNNQAKLLPKVANMSEVMDPIKTAEHFAMLNLKLMKWRLLPNIDLNIIKSQKCLLFGAGTLGCGIARNLMSWGFSNISFIDYGHVSFSNPVRQSLFTYADASQNKFKSAAAAERLTEILPSITSKGHVLQIPMPGHPVGDSMKEKTLENIHAIVDLIQEHDIIFLLTDSRESRWLPTLLGSFYGKIVITSALGFESYLVMRHGANKLYGDIDEVKDISGLKCIAGSNLGCYFCNDVTSPGNSIRDRTLDQQCTVTRPAGSNIAASIAVELVVSLLQHEKKNFAPAYYQLSIRNNDSIASIPEGILGILPHSVRGYLTTFQHILPATERFSQCIACSDHVLNEYKENGNEFLLKVFDSAEYLEKVTGLEEFAEMDNDIIHGFDDESD